MEANDANKGFKGRVRHKHGTSWPLYASATPSSATNTWTMIEITFDRTNNDFYSWRNGTILDNVIDSSFGFVDDGEFRSRVAIILEILPEIWQKLSFSNQQLLQ